MGDMTDRSRRAAAVVLIMAGAALLGGCGVKNMPVAPASGQTPDVVTDGQAAGGSSVLGDGDAASTVRSQRISSVQNDNMVSAAEITRNSPAAGSSFILDPLLN
ncbi:MAG TPA: hypothetical protein VGO17_09615 [Aurantimonas sp.]|jgi:ABC-type uncharacterized transport system auxiliary subunit|nr:hypothetical protein [Aurantimonas sp.]